MDVFRALTIDWTSQASTTRARRALQAWARRAPDLAGYATPADIVATITRIGHPARSCALLADLLVAADDALAARAVLQAVIPGLRQAAFRRWRNARFSEGPWRNAGEVAIDAVSAGWEVIQAHRGERHQRPAAIIIRSVERRLRQTHDQWRRDTRRTTTLDAVRHDPSQTGTDAAHSVEHQAATTIHEAVRMDVISSTAAAIIYATSVLGHPMREVEHALALPPGSGYRTAARGRVALRKWLGLSLPSTAKPFQIQRHEPDRNRTALPPPRQDDLPPDQLDWVHAVLGRNGTPAAQRPCAAGSDR